MKWFDKSVTNEPPSDNDFDINRIDIYAIERREGETVFSFYEEGSSVDFHIRTTNKQHDEYVARVRVKWALNYGKENF